MVLKSSIKIVASTVAVACCAPLLAAPALAYDEFDLSRIVAGDMPTVRDRFNRLGIRAGQFWFLPTVETGYFYDSNVFARSTGVVGDSGVYVSPTLDIKSDFGRHAFNVRLGGNHFAYFDRAARTSSISKVKPTGASTSRETSSLLPAYAASLVPSRSMKTNCRSHRA